VIAKCRRQFATGTDAADSELDSTASSTGRTRFALDREWFELFRSARACIGLRALPLN
jgi:hypothetical protein